MVGRVSNPLNMAEQAGKIKHFFPNSKVSLSQNIMTWKCTITPSPLSASYDIKLSYKQGEHPNVYVVAPKLALHPGAKKLPHVYSTEKQWLCIYFRRGREWRSNMHIADTIIPWTSEWLWHYECWFITGEWHGGGIHRDVTEAEKQVEMFNDTNAINEK